jgi:hypothetical protein
MSHFFQFESDFVASLRCIPMQVRFNLDTCGIKLKLHQWNQFTPEQREKLTEMPCTTPKDIQAYRKRLQRWVLDATDERVADLPVEAHPAWMDATAIPDSVEDKAEEVGVPISLGQWSTLTPIQRFALIKLSRSNHENKNFVPALREFSLINVS